MKQQSSHTGSRKNPLIRILLWLAPFILRFVMRRISSGLSPKSPKSSKSSGRKFIKNNSK